jgi:hypothetical protein
VNCARPEFGGGHVECVDRCRVVPVCVCEASLFENLLRLDTMVIEVGAKVGIGTPVLGTLVSVLVVQLGPMGTLTQVLDVWLGGRGTLGCAVAALSVWATLAVWDAPALTCTCLLHERKRELLVIVKIVQDVVIRISKGSVGRGLESGHEDRLQDIVKATQIPFGMDLEHKGNTMKLGGNYTVCEAGKYHWIYHFFKMALETTQIGIQCVKFFPSAGLLLMQPRAPADDVQSAVSHLIRVQPRATYVWPASRVCRMMRQGS